MAMDLYEEAQSVIDGTEIERRLSIYGDVKLEGSFVYRTMVDRDIDYIVYVSEGTELTYEFRAKIIADLARIPSAKAVQMSDVYHFPKWSSHDIDGIWFGLTPISAAGNKWNIDIWCVKRDAKRIRTVTDSLEKRLLSMDDETRETIVQIKQQAANSGAKQKGMTSAMVYDAVINHGIKSYDEFIKYTQIKDIKSL